MGEVHEQSESSLLASKLASPALPSLTIERPRLCQVLESAVERPVTVLDAPAGWGKTVALTAWARTRTDNPVSWLSLDPEDHDKQLLGYLTQAVASGLAEAGDGYRDDVVDMANAIAKRTEPLVLVIDNFHNLSDEPPLAWLEFLMRHAAPGLRLVLSGRGDPALPLHHVRLRGELTVLREPELSFTRSETGQLLDAAGLAVADRDVTALHRHAEGWPAGIRLAAEVAAEEPDGAADIARVSGVSGPVADYLTAEVLSALPPEVRDMLGLTSVCDRLCPGLVDALTGRSDGEAVLAGLTRFNAFLVPVPGSPGWCRCRRMFSELLRAKLGHQPCDQVAGLHARSARWLAANGLSSDALRHALLAGQWAGADEVFVQGWPGLIWHCRSAISEPATDAQAPRDVSADPLLALALAAERLGEHDALAAQRYLDEADQFREQSVEAGGGDQFDVMAAALRVAVAQQCGGPQRLTQAATQLLELLGLCQPSLTPVSDPAVAADVLPGVPAPAFVAAAALALTALGTAELANGDLEVAESSLSGGLEYGRKANLPCERLVAASRLALVRAIRGQFTAAEIAAEAALDLPPCPGQTAGVHRAGAYLALAVVEIHRDQIGSAQVRLRRAAAVCDASVEPVISAGIAAATASIQHESGDVTGPMTRSAPAAAHSPNGDPPVTLRAGSTPSRRNCAHPTGTSEGPGGCCLPGPMIAKRQRRWRRCVARRFWCAVTTRKRRWRRCRSGRGPTRGL